MKHIFSVTQINSYIHRIFESDYALKKIYLKGEVSNCKYHSSGHIYFTLKDGGAQIAAVMFAGQRKGLSFTLQEGQEVVVKGTVDVYERDGRYQLYAKEITLEGAGALYERYLALKQELEDMGMFAQEYKQPIPHFIRTLGVVTAPTGAAVQDIRNIAGRRNPYLQIILYPALVQGEGAAESIVKGIQMLDDAGVDVIIVGRGGGSIEDLWAFNEEIVARAIFECRTPLLCTMTLRYFNLLKGSFGRRFVSKSSSQNSRYGSYSRSFIESNHSINFSRYLPLMKIRRSSVSSTFPILVSGRYFHFSKLGFASA